MPEAPETAPVEENGSEPQDGSERRRPLVPPEIDPELERRRRIALARVRTFGDPALRTKAAEVESFDAGLAEEIGRMGHLMTDALGVGLAATQLGVMHRALVYRASPDSPFVAVVNPKLEWGSDELEEAEEACLSLPGVAVDVERHVHVRVAAQDETGEQQLLEASGLEARVLQHEMDHLDGILILDRTTKEQRKEAMRLLREGPTEWPDPGREQTELSSA
jgi:peptide deformylase